MIYSGMLQVHSHVSTLEAIRNLSDKKHSMFHHDGRKIGP